MISDPAPAEFRFVSCDELAARRVVGAPGFWAGTSSSGRPRARCGLAGSVRASGRGCRWAGSRAGRCNARITAGCATVGASACAFRRRPTRLRRQRRRSRRIAQWRRTASSGSPARAGEHPPPSPNGAMPASASGLRGPIAVSRRVARASARELLDVARRLPFVHDNVLGTPERPEITDYQAAITDQGVEATGVRVYQPDPYGTGQGDRVS